MEAKIVTRDNKIQYKVKILRYVNYIKILYFVVQF